MRGIDFECRSGEIFGLLGANGAGKTTTLPHALDHPDTDLRQRHHSGARRGPSPAPVRKSLGFYSASTALYPGSPPGRRSSFSPGSISTPGPVRGTRELAHRALRIEQYAGARIEKLSSGMKQKVSIARTVAHDPPLLIFDEPTVGLDVLNAIEMQEVIREFRAQGKTILFSTPHHERGREALRPHCHHPQRPGSRVRHARGAARNHGCALPRRYLRAFCQGPRMNWHTVGVLLPTNSGCCYATAARSSWPSRCPS